MFRSPVPVVDVMNPHVLAFEMSPPGLAKSARRRSALPA
jgi:hypothetical protein